MYLDRDAKFIFKYALGCYSYSFYVLAELFIIENCPTKIQKVTRDILAVWVDQETLDTTSTFEGGGSLDHDFDVVRSFSD